MSMNILLNCFHSFQEVLKEDSIGNSNSIEVLQLEWLITTNDHLHNRECSTTSIELIFIFHRNLTQSNKNAVKTQSLKSGFHKNSITCVRITDIFLTYRTKSIHVSLTQKK